MNTLDLNCDLGEGAGHDAALMPLITSANIACGGHAGDEATMREVVALAREHGVAVGAHPGFGDRDHFGRKEQAVTGAEAAALVLDQVARMRGIAGDALRHVKLHGALYNQVSRDASLAAAVATALARHEPGLAVYILAGSEFERAARGLGLRVASEGFADRTYQSDGSLTPRARTDALITDANAAAAQVLHWVATGRVRATDGTEISLPVDTICLHGDSVHAVEFARRLRRELQAAGITVKAFGR